MKKSLRWFLAAFAVVIIAAGLAVGLTSVASADSADSAERSSSIWVVECIDSDRSPEYSDGRNPWIKAFITVTYSDGQVKAFWDACGGRSYAGPDVLREMYCPEKGGTGEWIVHYSFVEGAIGCEDGHLIREPEPTPTPIPPVTPTPTPGPPEPQTQHWSFRWDQHGIWARGYFEGDEFIVIEHGTLISCTLEEDWCGLSITGPDTTGQWIALYFADGRHAGYWRPGMAWPLRPDQLGLPILPSLEQ